MLEISGLELMGWEFQDGFTYAMRGSSVMTNTAGPILFFSRASSKAGGSIPSGQERSLVIPLYYVDQSRKESSSRAWYVVCSG